MGSPDNATEKEDNEECHAVENIEFGGLEVELSQDVVDVQEDVGQFVEVGCEAVGQDCRMLCRFRTKTVEPLGLDSQSPGS